jgi:hypothetical protein
MITVQDDAFFASVAGCISNVECSVGGNVLSGGNLELRQTILYYIANFGYNNPQFRNNFILTT